MKNHREHWSMYVFRHLHLRTGTQPPLPYPPVSSSLHFCSTRTPGKRKKSMIDWRSMNLADSITVSIFPARPGPWEIWRKSWGKGYEQLNRKQSPTGNRRSLKKRKIEMIGSAVNWGNCSQRGMGECHKAQSQQGFQQALGQRPEGWRSYWNLPRPHTSGSVQSKGQDPKYPTDTLLPGQLYPLRHTQSHCCQKHPHVRDPLPFSKEKETFGTWVSSLNADFLDHYWMFPWVYSWHSAQALLYTKLPKILI